jgi:hypothetical protein
MLYRAGCSRIGEFCPGRGLHADGPLGGSFCDAEKSPTNDEDDYLCWAAAAANVLEWTGWGLVDGMTTTDEMMAYYCDHWTDANGDMKYAWDWWFDGTNPSQGQLGLSQVDVPGGGFYPSENFDNYYHENANPTQSLTAIDEYLHAGCGVTLAVYRDAGGGHAITCWGYEYTTDDDSTNYLGLYITESDDSMHDVTPEDELQYYAVEYDPMKSHWYFEDFRGYTDLYISRVEALTPIPEPATMSLFLTVSVLLWRRKK